MSTWRFLRSNRTVRQVPELTTTQPSPLRKIRAVSQSLTLSTYWEAKRGATWVRMA